jgi:hypothetical protein
LQDSGSWPSITKSGTQQHPNGASNFENQHLGITANPKVFVNTINMYVDCESIWRGICLSLGDGAEWSLSRISPMSCDCSLLPAVTEIDDGTPANSHTYRNIVSAAGVLCADRMPLFTKKFSTDSCFQQGPRRISGEPLQHTHIPRAGP